MKKQTEKQIELTIVIPAYNEEKNIRLGAIDKVLRFTETLSCEWEIVVVDDGSNDETAGLLSDYAEKNPRFRLLRNRHQGKAATVISGMLSGRGEIILFTDLDQATPISELSKIIPWFEKGYDIVIGSRSRTRTGAPLLRLVMARGFMILRSVILGLKGITDTQCGFKAFRSEVARQVFSRLKLYGTGKTVSGSMVTAGFDIEVLYLARRLGWKIKEVPVEWHYVETRRVNPVKDSWEGFLDILQIKINDLSGRYRQ
jgi:glycosyltransferase involved in cell wall biosynthesis